MNSLAIKAHVRNQASENDRAKESAALMAETSREVERLTLELSSVLSERSTAQDWREAKAHSTFSWRGQKGHQPPADALMDDEFSDDGVVPANTKAWLKTARRTRRREAVKRALAWILTIGVGGLIIMFAVYLVTGSLPDFSWLFPSGTGSPL